MHRMHSGSVPTTMLAVLKLVKILISANMYGMHSTSVVHQSVKPKVVVIHATMKLWYELYALAHVYITVCC